MHEQGTSTNGFTCDKQTSTNGFVQNGRLIDKRLTTSTTDSPIPLKQLRLQPKQLRHNARLALLRNQICFNSNKFDYSIVNNRRQKNFLVINNKYLKTIFDEPDAIVTIGFDDGMFESTIRMRKVCMFVLIGRPSMRLILEMIKPKHLKINTIDNNMTRERIKEWAEFCGTLRDSDFLTNITASFNYVEEISSRMLLDFVSNKIKNLEVNQETFQRLNTFFYPNLVLDQLKINNLIGVNQLVRIKAKNIAVYKNTNFLLNFWQTGSFKPNPYIEHLTIGAFFECYDEEDEELVKTGENDKNSNIWKDKYLNKYQEAFKSLKTVNTNLKLELVDKHNCRVLAEDKLYHCLLHINQLIANAKLLIDVAQKQQMQISEIKLKGGIRVKNCKHAFIERVANALNLERKTDTIKGSTQYEDTKISVSKYFEEYEDESDTDLSDSTYSELSGEGSMDALSENYDNSGRDSEMDFDSDEFEIEII